MPAEFFLFNAAERKSRDVLGLRLVDEDVSVFTPEALKLFILTLIVALNTVEEAYILQKAEKGLPALNVVVPLVPYNPASEPAVKPTPGEPPAQMDLPGLDNPGAKANRRRKPT